VQVRIQTLGDVRLLRSDGEVIPIRRTPLALIAYLARRAPRGVSRAELSALFWGDRAEERARQSLRQALLEARQVLGDTLEVTPDQVRLTGGDVQLDIALFEEDVKQGRHQAAIDRWAGEFFPTAEGIGGEDFERWIGAERVTLLRRLGVAMQHLIGAAELRSDWRAAADAAERWAAAAPLDERANARVVEALRMDGRAGLALERHAEFVVRLRQALDVDPSPEFLALAGGLESQVRVESAREGRQSTALRAPALVGRGHEISEIMVAIRTAAAGTPRVVVVDCGGGRGKTRLCEEIAGAAGKDTLVLRARGDRAHRSEPYTTLRVLLAPLGEAPGSAGAPPEALAEAARLIPQLASQFKYLPAATGSDETLSVAVGQLLAAVSEETPVLLLLDDAHAVDAASWKLITAVTAMLSGRVAMVLFVDEGTSEARAGLRAVLASPLAVRVRLQPLDVAGVDAMLASMLDLATEERQQLAARLHAETRGVPLLVYETVAELVHERLVTLDSAGAWRVSAGLEGRPLPLPVAVIDRINSLLVLLAPESRALVDAASVIGTPVDGVLLEGVSEIAPGAAATAFRELIGRHVLRELPGTGSFEFTHPIVGTVAYALLSPAERQALHRRAAHDLAMRDMATTSERSVLPYHLARAGNPKTPAGAVEAIVTPARPPRRVRPVVWASAAALLLAVAAGGSALVAGRNARAADSFAGGRVIVGAFQTSATDPRVDRVRDITVDWIVRGLDETGLVEIVTSRAGPLGERVGVASISTDEALRSAAIVAQAGTMVNGTIHQIGDSIEFEGMIRSTRDGTLLRMIPAVRASLANPLPGIQKLQAGIVGTLAALLDPAYDGGGGGPRSPPSYDAYVAFMRGENAYEAGDFARATTAYGAAAAIDSMYTLPLLRMAYAAFATGRCDRVDSMGTALDRQRTRLSQFETQYLDRVRALCRYDWDAANEAAARMADLAPRSQMAQFIAARSALFTNRPAEARRRLRLIDPARLAPTVGDRYWLMQSLALHLVGDASSLRALGRTMGTLTPTLPTIAARMFAAGALGRAGQLNDAFHDLLVVTKRSGQANYLLVLVALDELRVHGGRDDAAPLAARFAEALAPPANEPRPASGDTTLFVRAELLYRAERWAEARTAADSLVNAHPASVYVLALAGRAAARMGDRPRAIELSARLRALADPSLQGRNTYARAAIAAILDRGEAIRLLQASVTQGLAYIFDRDMIYLGHADMDFESVAEDPVIHTLRRTRG